MAATFKILPQLDENNRARLESKPYTKMFTDVPNRVLPDAYKVGLGAIFRALTGEEFEETASTFTVKADPNGTFQRLYSPSLFASEEGGLVIRWGNKDIPIVTSPGKIGVANAPKGTKFSFKDEQFGKYTEPALSVSVTHEGTIYSLPIPIKKKDLKEEMTADLLDVLLDENPESIVAKVTVAPDISKRNERPQQERMVGPYLKVSSLPKGEYKVTTYRVKEGGQYGEDYFLQVQIPEPFSAMVRVQVDGEWVEQDTEISDWAIIRPNTAMKKTLAAKPLISPSEPATLKVLETYEYNGNPAVKVSFKCSKFVEDAEAFDLDF